MSRKPREDKMVTKIKKDHKKHQKEFMKPLQETIQKQISKIRPGKANNRGYRNGES